MCSRVMTRREHRQPQATPRWIALIRRRQLEYSGISLSQQTFLLLAGGHSPSIHQRSGADHRSKVPPVGMFSTEFAARVVGAGRRGRFR